MAQSSAPLIGVQFTDVAWRDLFGDEPGVVGDLDGTAYAVTLPTDSDVAMIGSATQPSLSRVAGFSHRIPTGQPEGVSIPAAGATARTDIVAVRYDPANTSAPGPCRLAVIGGTSSGLPAYDAAPPGMEDLPLWAITRQPGQALSQATLQRLFPRVAPVLDLPETAPLPTSSPLGTAVRRGAMTYRRELSSEGVAVWAADTGISATDRVPITNVSSTAPDTWLTGLVTLPKVAAPSRLVLRASGRTGFSGSADRKIGWEFENLPAQATNVSTDFDNTRITAPLGAWVGISTTLSMDLPADVAPTFRLAFRADGAAWNRGGVTWTRGPVL